MWTQRHKEDQRSEISTTGLRFKILEGPRAFAGSALAECHFLVNIVTVIGEYNRTIEDLKEDYPDQIKNLEEALVDYMGENYLKTLKTEIPDKWKDFTKKLAYPYEFFNSIDGCQKPVNNLNIKDFFSKLKNKCPKDE